MWGNRDILIQFKEIERISFAQRLGNTGTGQREFSGEQHIKFQILVILARRDPYHRMRRDTTEHNAHIVVFDEQFIDIDALIHFNQRIAGFGDEKILHTHASCVWCLCRGLAPNYRKKARRARC